MNVRVHRSPSLTRITCPKVVGFGAEENDEDGDRKPEEESSSAYGEVSKLIFLPPSAKMADAVAIMDIPAFTEGLPLFPYHKILE